MGEGGEQCYMFVPQSTKLFLLNVRIQERNRKEVEKKKNEEKDREKEGKTDIKKEGKTDRHKEKGKDRQTERKKEGQTEEKLKEVKNTLGNKEMREERTHKNREKETNEGKKNTHMWRDSTDGRAAAKV